MSAAGLIGVAGGGFMVLAGFAALRLVLGTELSALVVGMVLLVLAAILARSSLSAGQKVKGKEPTDRPAIKHSSAALQPTDPATLAVFTVAYVLGRRLADRQRD